MKKQFLILVMMSLSMIALAQSIAIDGIYTIDGIRYNLSGTSATLVSGDYKKFSGMTIPQAVNYKNKSYIVTAIGTEAFMDCTNLKFIIIPNSVTSIGENALSGCTGLTSIEIPNAVTSIGERTFMGCSGLASIIVADGNIVYDSREGCNAIIETATNTLISGCQNTIIPIV